MKLSLCLILPKKLIYTDLNEQWNSNIDFNIKNFVVYYLPIKIGWRQISTLVSYQHQNKSFFTMKMWNNTASVEDNTNIQNKFKIKYVSEVVHNVFF